MKSPEMGPYKYNQVIFGKETKAIIPWSKDGLINE